MTARGLAFLSLGVLVLVAAASFLFFTWATGGGKPVALEVTPSPSPTLSPTLSPTPLPSATPTSTPTPTPTEPPPTATPTPQPTPGRVAVRVVEVLEGDTISVQTEAGVERVRYLDIDAPPANTPQGAKARDFNRSLVEGKEVEIEKDRSERDDQGALLRYVYLGGKLVNGIMVEQGWAVFAPTGFDRKYEALLQGLERQAQEAGRGLWSVPEEPQVGTPLPTATPSPSPPTATPIPSEAAIIVTDFSYSGEEAKGDLNDEYVTLANNSPKPINLGGWTLSNSAGEVYTFSGLWLAPGTFVRLHTGLGNNSETDLYWGRTSEAWKDGGDTLTLRDPSGVVQLRYSYTPEATGRGD